MSNTKKTFKQNTTTIQDGQQRQSSGNVGETHNSNSYEELNVKIEGTPFVRRKTDEGYIITMGNHKITEATKTAKEAEDLIFKLNWLTLIRVIATAVDNVLEEKQRIAKEEMLQHLRKEDSKAEVN